jgi:predicted SAM-dependent methyltransferase
VMAIGFSRPKIRVGRPLLSYAKIQAAIGWVIRNKAAFAKMPKRGAYIDVGCGPNIRSDFYNIDYSWLPGIDLCWDITHPLPFASESVGGIFTEHCVEHIEYSDFLKLAGELYRALMPGGTVRIVVPDGELYARCYLQNEPMLYADCDKGSGIYMPFMSMNRIFYSYGHRFIYDFETLRAVLTHLGFRNIARTAFGQGRDRRLLIDSEARAIESIYVEATK